MRGKLILLVKWQNVQQQSGKEKLYLVNWLICLRRFSVRVLMLPGFFLLLIIKCKRGEKS